MGDTIWYRIKHSDYPHCQQSITLMSLNSVSEMQVQRLAEAFACELRFVTGLDAEIEVWVD